MKTIKSQVWYLEMRREWWMDRQLEGSQHAGESHQTEESQTIEQGPRSPEYQGNSGLPEGFSAVPLHKPDTSTYLELYKSVGSSFNWCDRLLMPKETLEKILHSDTTEICLLKYHNEHAGFVEYDKSTPGETEMVYFGLIEKFTGKKAGYPFLRWAINHALEQGHAPEQVYAPEHGHASEHGINRLWLHTCDLDHPAALPLYQKAGFVIYRTETVDQPILEL